MDIYMNRARNLIITPDGLEKTVYSIHEENVSNLLKFSILELFSLKHVPSPKFKKFQSSINSPINIIKHKSNINLQTSLIISMNDIVFNCKTQKSSKLHKSLSWQPLCEDIIEMNIKHNIIQNLNFSVFAVRNIIDDKHYYFADIHTINNIKQLLFIISCFLEENEIKKSFGKLSNKILNNHNIDEILDTLNEKIFLKENMFFLLTCVSEYKQPDVLMACLLKNKLLPKLWISGQVFYKEFSESVSFSASSQLVIDLIINTYDKYILYFNLDNNLNKNKRLVKNNKKCVKI